MGVISRCVRVCDVLKVLDKYIDILEDFVTRSAISLGRREGSDKFVGDENSALRVDLLS